MGALYSRHIYSATLSVALVLIRSKKKFPTAFD